jgi:thiol-disulfide isomerase/thioredoxin
MDGLRETERTWAPRVLCIAVTVAAVGVCVWIIGGGEVSVGNARTSSDSVIDEFDAGARTTQEPFTGRLLSGRVFDSDELAGEVVVYNVWGSWCAPCRGDAPAVAALAEEFAGEVTFVGINVRDNEAAARGFERQYDVPYDRIAASDSAAAMLSFDGVLFAAAAPTMVVVDRDGGVAARVIGDVSEATLRALVETVLAEQADANRTSR